MTQKSDTTMKKAFFHSILLTVLVFCPLLLRGQDRLYVVTDRDSYLSGDVVFCSVFALDAEGAKEPFSAVSYLELVSTDGTVAEVKIGLFDGRGCGSFRIPATAPTGNYRLLAYTARSSEAEPAEARLLSVYNTTSSARVTDGVAVVKEQSDLPKEQAAASKGSVTFDLPGKLGTGEKGLLRISGADADLCISLFHLDGLNRVTNPVLADYVSAEAAPAAGRASTGEYEGEIITASVEGLERGLSAGEGEVTAFLSTAGEPSNVYVGRAAGNGQIQFFTGNIYGERELVCEVVSLYGQSAHISLKSPFRNPELQAPVPVLELCEAQRQDILDRKAALIGQAELPLDTLVRFLPKREDLLLEGTDRIRYHLDDYNRFPTVQEICTEFVSELNYSRQNGKWSVRIVQRDAASGRRYQLENVLVMMDGVVLTDQGKLADFDAMLLEDIDIYRKSLVIGEVPFNGLVNFITKKNYVTALDFPDNTRIVDFKGLSYPVSYGGAVPETEKDLRQLLLWLPAQEISSEETLEIPFRAPDYAGTFRLVMQGLQKDGTPVYIEKTFSTR